MMKILSPGTLSPDAQWLQRLQHDDTEGLALLMDKYYRDLFHYASKFTRDEGLARDCIQEVFISLWERRKTATAILSPRHYLLRAIKNKVLKALYKKDRVPFDLPDEYDFFQEFNIEQVIIEKQLSEEKAQKLRQALSSLSKRQQEVIYLKFYQHLDHGQIAEQMDISRQSVYNLIHESLQKLRSVWATPTSLPL
ncbi:MAG: sigma-70 family RNA polymerase sigma factor [Chitinophagaceae bacterium]|nr:sigma-70 family RNA polymerase sigma factor [Chitinophagaceae bacterium]